MATLPAQQTTGRVQWRVWTDFIPSGSTSPIATPARGTVEFKPMRPGYNFQTLGSDPFGVTFAYQTHTIALNADGALDVSLLADFDGSGWTWQVTPRLEVRADDSSWQPAPADLAKPFNFHLDGGQTVDLADVRPLGTVASGGTVVAPTTTVTPTLKGNVASASALPTGAATGDQYVTTDTNHLWQWGGSTWVDLGPTQSGTSTSTLTTADMTV